MKKPYVLYCVIIFLTFLSNSVLSDTIDSLKREITLVKENGSKIDLYHQLALQLTNNGKSKEAITIYQKVLSLAGNDDQIKASTYNEIGNIRAELGENEFAFKAYETALKFCGSGFMGLQAKINKNIGALFLSWKKLNEALTYYEAAESLAIKAKDLRTVADLANNKGTVYEQQNKYSLAQQSYQKALVYYQKHAVNDRIALTYNNLAILSKVQKQYLLATGYYQKSVENANKANNKWLSAAIGNNLGNLWSEIGDYANAEKALKDALAIEKEIDAKELLFETLENLGDNEKRRANYQLAFEYLKQAAEAKNNFINTENTERVARLKEEFDAENKQKAINLLNKEAKIQQLTLTKRTNIIFIIIGLFIVVVVFSYLIFDKYRLKQQSKIKLATAETRNQVQAEKLRISRELHDNIGAQLSFINGSIQSLALADSENWKLQQTQLVTQNTIKELRSTVWLINQQEFYLEEFVVKLREYLKPYYGGKPEVSIQNNVAEDLVLEPNIATNLFRIIQEALNNSIKYAEASLVSINFEHLNGILEINIADDGKGFDMNQGTLGYGLKNMKSRIEKINGTYLINARLGEGTQIQIKIHI